MLLWISVSDYYIPYQTDPIRGYALVWVVSGYYYDES